MRSLVANGAWLLSALPGAHAFRRATDRVEEEQARVLVRIVRANEDSDFGRSHDFKGIRSTGDFQNRVAVATYDDLAPYIERAASGERGVLTAEPVTHFVPTSGSTAVAKLIPYTNTLLGDFQRAIAPWIVNLFTTDPSLLGGSAYWSVSPLLQRQHRTTGGIPIGFDSDDAYLGGMQRRLVRAIQATPSAVSGIVDLNTFRYVTLYFLVSCGDLRLMSVWNPTFLQLLLSPLEDWGDDLAADVAAGSISRLASDGSPGITEIRLQEAAAVKRSRGRSAEIAAALRLPSPARRHAALWPRLRLISCWADAAATDQATEVAGLFPDVPLQPKGLLSTESFVSIPMGSSEGSVLAVRSHFFEFREVDDEEILLAAQLQPGRRYEVIVTTSGGLYRYATGDLIEIKGLIGLCPVLRFVGRKGIVSDRFGEKLDEVTVRSCLERGTSTIRQGLRFTMVGYEEPAGMAPGYALFIESSLPDEQLIQAAAAVDQLFQESFHYRYCRDLGQLAPMRCFRIIGDAAESYLAACVRLGQRLGDVKPAALHRERGWSTRFEGKWLQ